MKAYMFAGQGSQKKGMGQGLFEKYHDWVTAASNILGYDAKTLCLKDPGHSLNQTQFTQPLLYLVQALMYRDRLEREDPPHYLVGHSLGEYTALFAAGAFSFETGFRLVKKRAEIMALEKNGGMAAILGLSYEEVNRILAEQHLHGIDIANLNARKQVVISGMQQDIADAKSIFEAHGARLYFPLNVSGAFHSRFMRHASTEFSAFLRHFTFSPLNIPVISGVTGKPYRQNQIVELLERQIVSPVRWYDAISYLLNCGVNTFHEISPGDVLTKILDHIKADPLPVHKDPKDLPEVRAARGGTDRCKQAQDLGAADFRADYGLQYAYVAGAMVHGIASRELVVRMANAGMLAYLGTGGVRLGKIEEDILFIQKKTEDGRSFGINLLNGHAETGTVDLILKHAVRNVEAAAYTQITEELVRLRLQGLSITPTRDVFIPRRIMAKLSRPEVAAGFLAPPPKRIVDSLLKQGKITSNEASLAQLIPMADDICVEADSGGHTDAGAASVLLPAIIRQCREAMRVYGYNRRIRVGAAGGIGTPEAAAAAFIMGADFVLTGSINQCTVEAGTSDMVKDMLQGINIQDTAYAPAGDMFESGARVQVLKKGVFFPARANKLYDLYRQFDNVEEIDENTLGLIQDKYFRKPFSEVWEDCKRYYTPGQIAEADLHPKQKMAFLFRWYFGYSARIAEEGLEQLKIDFQIHCGPALGAFNQWVRGTDLESWRHRHVDEIGLKIMTGAAELLNNYFHG